MFSQIYQEWFGGISGNGGVATDDEQLTIARLQSNWISTDGTCKSHAPTVFVYSQVHRRHTPLGRSESCDLLGFEVCLSPSMKFREISLLVLNVGNGWEWMGCWGLLGLLLLGKIPCVKRTSKFQTDLADLDDTLVTPIQTSRSEVVIMSV